MNPDDSISTYSTTDGEADEIANQFMSPFNSQQISNPWIPIYPRAAEGSALGSIQFDSIVLKGTRKARCNYITFTRKNTGRRNH